MTRRELFMGVVAGPAFVGFQQRAVAQAVPLDSGAPARVGAAKLDRISIMTYNFTSRLKLEGRPPGPDRVLEIFDIPQMFADTYGVHHVEMQHSHFATTETAYLKEFRARVEKVKSQMTQINVEFGQTTLSAADPVQRDQAIDLTMRWVDHALVLNCPRVMINQGQLTNESKDRATVALRRMSEYAKTKGVKIAVETRLVGPGTPPAPGAGLPLASPGGPPAWELVRDVVEATGSYSNVDIGNIMAPDQASLHSVIKGLFPTSSGNMHMKLSPNWDLATVVRFTNGELGYKGLYSIEVDPPLIRGVYDTILANI